MIKLVVLGSGSKGNSIYFDVDGFRFLVDCGFTKIATKKRLATFGRVVEDIKAVFVTHYHGDHVSPWIVKAELIEEDLGKHPFITVFDLSHDSPCVGYTIKDKSGNKVAIIPDTGCIPEMAIAHLFDCSAILIETNYDIETLVVAKYPFELLERIASDHGHLRNECAAELVETVACEKLQYLVGLHLSSNNNHPDLVRFCLSSAGTGAEVIVADQKIPTKMITII